jgi:predicted alpha-1,2-mannosidase
MKRDNQHAPLIKGLLSIMFMALTGAAETTPADYVNPLIDTHKSRWFYFSSACRPFGMVNLSPDTKVGGDWMNGYIYGETNIHCFSHVHCWQLYGVPVMPSIGEVQSCKGLAAAASPFAHANEVVRPGYHKVFLKRYGITAELTSTMRVGFHRYTFPASDSAHIAFSTSATLMDKISSSAIRQVSPVEIAGYSVMAATRRRPKPFTIYFVARFNKPMEFGAWENGQLLAEQVKATSGTNVGGFVRFKTQDNEQVLMKVAISYTNEENARKNLETELPEWDFDHVIRDSHNDWNNWLGRIAVEGGTKQERVKFYTDLWHALLGRRTVSDADGSYADNTGETTVVRRVKLDSNGKPIFPHYNFDALWGSQWSLNLLWSFAYPEVMDGFCATMVDMYRNGGLIPRGPSGGNYTFVMIGDPATPFFAAAYNKGIRSYDVEAAYAGLRKNALPSGIRDHAGYEHTNAISGGMNYYVERGYVPEGVAGTGMHKDGAAMTLEYAYQDWCLGQFALALGKTNDATWLTQRSFNYTNLWDAQSKWIRPRNKDGSWLADFVPVGKKGSFNTKGFCEANSAIYTHTLTHDLPGLIGLFGGSEQYVSLLTWQFEQSIADNFVVPHGEHGSPWVDYDNQPGTAMAHLFNFAKRPDLSQRWVREVKRRAFSDITPFGGYNGDDDQGQMGALGVLMAIGLFDVQGGAGIKSTYQITAPIFDRVTLQLDKNYFPAQKFMIVTRNNSAVSDYIQSATLNGVPLNRFWLSHVELVRGGTLDLNLGSKPSTWAVESQKIDVPK